MDSPPSYELMDVEAVQRALNRSRASIYRYANTDPTGQTINLPFNAKRLNPEHRSHIHELLQFHPTEVARFAQDVLKIRNVKIEVLPSPHQRSEELLQAILIELKAIRSFLEKTEPEP